MILLGLVPLGSLLLGTIASPIDLRATLIVIVGGLVALLGAVWIYVARQRQES